MSKTDVRQSWIKNPKSAPPRQTKTMEELFPAPDRFVNYRLANNNFITVSVLHAYDIHTVNDFIFEGFNIAWVFALLILLYMYIFYQKTLGQQIDQLMIETGSSYITN